MKYIHTFNQHINESESLPSDVTTIDHNMLPKNSEMVPFTEEEKDLMIEACKLIGFDYKILKNTFLMTVQLRDTTWKKPYIFFIKRNNGGYLVDINSDIDFGYDIKKNGEPRIKPNPSSRDIFYETKSIESAIYMALRDIGEGVDVEWIKIK